VQARNSKENQTDIDHVCEVPARGRCDLLLCCAILNVWTKINFPDWIEPSSRLFPPLRKLKGKTKNIGFQERPTNACNTWNFCGGSTMAMTLPPDFKESLKLLKEHDVRYLLIGGYAVGYHGYPRATEDMDIWIAVHPDNAQRMVATLKAFEFDDRF
jgi:hypothetical protein